LDIRISISIIAILVILFGITITTSTNSAWSQNGRDISMDSQKCVNNNIDSEIAFSWKGYPANDDLEIQITDSQDKGKVVASETIKAKGANSGSGDIFIYGSKITWALPNPDRRPC
jgi:hypothetical protein